MTKFKFHFGKSYSLLKKLENFRYCFILLAIQIPLVVLSLFLVYHVFMTFAVGSVMANIQNLGLTLLNLPLFVKIWIGLALVVIVFSRSNLFSFRGQYIYHLQNLMLIEFAEFQYLSQSTEGEV